MVLLQERSMWLHRLRGPGQLFKSAADTSSCYPTVQPPDNRLTGYEDDFLTIERPVVAFPVQHPPGKRKSVFIWTCVASPSSQAGTFDLYMYANCSNPIGYVWTHKNQNIDTKLPIMRTRSLPYLPHRENLHQVNDLGERAPQRQDGNRQKC